VFEPQEMTISQLQAAMGQVLLSARELVLYCLERIARLDRGKGGLNSVLEVNPEALFIADGLDAERARGKLRGPLHGIPILLKDTINTADSMHTSAGSLALANNLAPYDAHVAARLRAAGAILLGKANMTELANFMGERMPGGYSSRGGQVLSPYDPQASPYGSSSGSAVAVAARLCSAALGTENLGSIVYPAQQSGVVGLKPTLGLVSRHGNLSTTYSLDTIGPMAGCVMDAAIVLGAIAGRDEGDPSTWQQGDGPAPDYAAGLDGEGLRGARIGLPREGGEAACGAHALALARLHGVLREAGAQLIEVEELGPIIAETDVDPIFFCEHKSCLNAYLATLRPGQTCASLEEIIASNRDNPSRALRYGQPILLEVQGGTSGTQTEPAYLRALLRREEAIRRLDALFAQGQLDALLCPGPQIIAPATGFPSLTLPLGCDEKGMPMGCFWMARRYAEGTLLRLAYAVEARLGITCRPPL
jgi:amidase